MKMGKTLYNAIEEKKYSLNCVCAHCRNNEKE